MWHRKNINSRAGSILVLSIIASALVTVISIAFFKMSSLNDSLVYNEVKDAGHRRELANVATYLASNLTENFGTYSKIYGCANPAVQYSAQSVGAPTNNPQILYSCLLIGTNEFLIKAENNSDRKIHSTISIEGRNPRNHCFGNFNHNGGGTITNPAPIPAFTNLRGNFGAALGNLNLSNVDLSSDVYLKSTSSMTLATSTHTGQLFQDTAPSTTFDNLLLAGLASTSQIWNSLKSKSTVVGNAGVSLVLDSNLPAHLLTSNSFGDTGMISNAPGGTIPAGGEGRMTGIVSTTYLFNVENIVLSNNSSLVLEGTPSTRFIFNVRKFLSLSSGAKIRLDGGVPPRNVLFNVRDDWNFDVTLSGSSSLEGVVLAPNRNIKLTGSSVITGEAVARGTSLSGQSQILNTDCDL